MARLGKQRKPCTDCKGFPSTSRGYFTPLRDFWCWVKCPGTTIAQRRGWAAPCRDKATTISRRVVGRTGAGRTWRIAPPLFGRGTHITNPSLSVPQFALRFHPTCGCWGWGLDVLTSSGRSRAGTLCSAARDKH